MTISRKGFTLIELLITIAIMAILATALMLAVKGVQKQARTTKCMTNLKNLHGAVVNYFADNGNYPCASSYALHEKWNHGGGKTTESYTEYNGWVTWVCREGSKLDARDPQEHDEFGGGKKKNDAAPKKYRYLGTGYKENDKVRNRVRRSITEGCLYKYTGKSLSCYVCPAFEKEGAIRTYAMNKYFKSRMNPSLIRIRPQDISAAGSGGRDSSHTALFVEIAEMSGDCKGDGKEGDVNHTKDDLDKREDYSDDAVWDYENEKIGFWHKRSGDMFGHVVFIDGHTESISQKMTRSSLDQLCLDLGKGEYDPTKYRTTSGK